MIEQHKLLNAVAALIDDDGELLTTVGEAVGANNAANLRQAHAK